MSLTLTDYIDYGILPAVINLFVFWFIAILFMVLDSYCDNNKILEKWKYQGKALAQKGIDWKKYYITLRLVIINQLLSNVLFTIALTKYNKQMTSNSIDYKYLPFQILGIIITEDILFYAVHRALHIKILYKYIHSIHHEWTAPVAVRALYSHPIEHFLGNILPVVITAYVYKLDWLCFNLWLNIATINALLVHSDFDLGGFGEGHDKHHKYRKCQYGALGLVDYLMGTYNPKS